MGWSLDRLVPAGLRTVGTAKAGAALTVLGEFPRPVPLELVSGAVRVRLMTKPVVIEGLTMDVNICGPFLRSNGIDQLHSQGVLSVRGTHIPLLRPQEAQYVCASVPIYVDGDQVIPPLCDAPLAVVAPEVAEMSVDGAGDAEFLCEGEEVFSSTTDLHPVVAALVNCPASGRLAVRVLNSTASPIRVQAGLLYGNLTPLGCAQAPNGAGIAALGDSPPEKATSARKADSWPPARRRQYVEEEFKLAECPWLANPKDRQLAAHLLVKYWDVISIDGEFGQTSLIEHEIHTAPGPAIKCKYRPPNPVLEEDLDRQLDEWLKYKVIEGSQSQWSFALVAARKKNSDRKRWCVDYPRLNEVTIKDTFPLPNIEDNLARLGQSKVFSAIDGCGAYHVVNIRKEDRPKTAFATHRGLFQFRQMPFGLTNAPATYCRLVQLVLAGIPHEMAIPYLDDTCVHSRDVPSHFRALEAVLAAFQRAGLKLQAKKCHLFQKEIEYLGHVISERGVQPQPEYVRAVQDWPLPSTKTQARAFLGKVGYYKRFIKGYSGIARPWTDVTGKVPG